MSDTDRRIKLPHRVRLDPQYADVTLRLSRDELMGLLDRADDAGRDVGAQARLDVLEANRRHNIDAAMDGT